MNIDFSVYTKAADTRSLEGNKDDDDDDLWLMIYEFVWKWKRKTMLNAS